MRDAGAREVHMRIASPPTKHSCFYGVDTPERAKLLAAQMSVEAMARLHQRRQPRLHLDRRALPRARRRARRARSRSAATPASPAIIRPRLTDCRREGQRRLACRWSPAANRYRRRHDRFEAASPASSRLSPAPAAASAPRPPKRSRAAGAHVILVARTAKALEAGRGAHPRRRRQRDHRAARPHRRRHRSASSPRRSPSAGTALDILVLNAAMLGSLTPVEHIDAKEYAPGAQRSTCSPTRR